MSVKLSQLGFVEPPQHQFASYRARHDVHAGDHRLRWRLRWRSRWEVAGEVISKPSRSCRNWVQSPATCRQESTSLLPRFIGFIKDAQN